MENDGDRDWKLAPDRFDQMGHLQSLIDKASQLKTEKPRVRDRGVDALLVHSHCDESYVLSHRISQCQKRSKSELAEWLNFKFKMDLGEEWNPINLPTESRAFRRKYLTPKTKGYTVCQSLWCLKCRKVVARVFEDKLKARLSERLRPGTYTNEDFRHITGVVGVCDVDTKKVEQLLKDDGVRWRRIRNRLRKIDISKSPFVECAYEFEVVNWDALSRTTGSESTHKRKQISELIKHFGVKSTHLVFVHFHGVTNLSDEDIDEVFREEYFLRDGGKKNSGKPLTKTNKKTGLYIQRFHKDKTLEENLRKVASYPFKSAHRYKHSFIGSDYSNGEYIEKSILSKLIMLYHDIQGRNWSGLFRSATHPISVDIAKYRDLYPDDHAIWYHWKSVLEKPHLIDSVGNVYVTGWNPNVVLEKDKSFYNFVIVKQHVIGRQRVFLEGREWVNAYRNIWSEWSEGLLKDRYQTAQLDFKSTFDQFYGSARKQIMERYKGNRFRDGYRYRLIGWTPMGRGSPRGEVKHYKPKTTHQLGNLVAHTATGEFTRIQNERKYLERCLRFLDEMDDVERSRRIDGRLKLSERLVALDETRVILDLTEDGLQKPEYEDEEWSLEGYEDYEEYEDEEWSLEGYEDYEGDEDTD